MVVILTGGKLLDNVGLDGLGLIMIVMGPLWGGGDKYYYTTNLTFKYHFLHYLYINNFLLPINNLILIITK